MNENFQKHFRRTPDWIYQDIQKINSDYVAIATTLLIKQADINNPRYHQLGLSFDGKKLTFSSILTPDKLRGSFSKKNLNGYAIVHRDQPKYPKTYTWEVPNFGDPSRGYHDVSRTMMVYPRTQIAPREWSLNLEILKTEYLGAETLYTIKVSIDILLNKKAPDFEADLFFGINLLQENVFSCGVFDANATEDDYIRSRTVGWQLFPPGKKDQVVAELKSHFRNVTPEQATKIQARADYIESLHPLQYIVGQGMNSRYFGAKFKDDLVVFENIEYGNAIYILFDNWEQLSKMSRIDIIQRHQKDFIRLVHRKGWEQTLKHNLDRWRS